MINTAFPAFSVAMAVYNGDDVSNFKVAVDSVYHKQSVKPAEIIIVVDGKVSEAHEKALSEIQANIPIVKIVRFPVNRGHAAVRQAGLESSTHDWIAVMDADDISCADRFEKQLKEIQKRPEVSIIGGQISEFVNTPNNIVGERIVPLSDVNIKNYLKGRCPMNLVSVMYRKKDIMKAGGFIDWYCEEDYYLWVRLAIKNYKFANIPDVLVNVRVGYDMYRRRGGWKYFKSEKKLQDFMLKHHIISPLRYFYNVTGRFAIQVAMPNRLRGLVFQKIFRKQTDISTLNSDI